MQQTTDWIMAICAFLALIAAVWAGMTSRRLVHVESSRDQKAREREVRAQATRVSAWCVHCPAVESDVETAKDGVLIHNASAVPVYDVVVRSTSRRGEPQRDATMTIMPPGDLVLMRNRQYHWDFPQQLDEVGGIARPVTKKQEWAVQSIEFTDAHGLRWRRTGAQLAPVGTPVSLT